MRSAALALFLAASAWPGDKPPQPAPQPYRPLTSEERWRLYAREVFADPLIPFRVAAGAGIAQWRDEPSEWGQGAEGFGRRVGNRYGRLLVQESSEAAGAALLGHDVRYVPAPGTPFGSRISHAMTANFVTRNRHGNRVFHASRFGGIVAAEVVSRQWMPERYRSAERIGRGTAIQLGFGIAFDLLREFTPDLKRALHRK